MSYSLHPPLTAKNGHTLMVIIVGRVSDPGPGKQSILSLDDQESMHMEWLKANTKLPYEVIVVAGSGSGEILDREEYLRLLELVSTGLYDLVLAEDLGRIVRRIYAHLFAEHCVDHGTRLISKNDHVDTAVDGWEDRSIFSAWHHERSNRDTSDRIKRAHRGRFVHGGALRRLIPGIIKPVGAKTDAELSKDPYWEQVYDEWFQRLENGATFSDIADWLNASHVPTGCKRGEKKAKTQWDCQLVGQRTRNKALKGLRVRNERMSVRINKTGRRETKKAPPELRQERFCPHLVFIEPDRFDRVMALLAERNGMYARGRHPGIDPRRGISRKRSRYPGQATFCGICGRKYLFGGHGQVTHMMCDGARRYRCWNGATFDAGLAANKIAALVAHEVETLDDFDAVFQEMVEQEAQRVNSTLDVEIARLRQEISNLEAQAANLLGYLKEGVQSELVRKEIPLVEQELHRLRLALDEAERTRPRAVVLPCASELQQLYRESFQELAADSFEFARHMRRLIPRLVVFPHMICDGGPIVLRAKFRLQLGNLVPDVGVRTVLQQPLDKILQVDLFELPQRERFRNNVAEQRKVSLTERTIAKQLGITQPAVQKAAALQRLMDKLGITNPYVPVTEPPGEGKLRRHLHPRYQFEPLDNAGAI